MYQATYPHQTHTLRRWPKPSHPIVFFGFDRQGGAFILEICYLFHRCPRWDKATMPAKHVAHGRGFVGSILVYIAPATPTSEDNISKAERAKTNSTFYGIISHIPSDEHITTTVNMYAPKAESTNNHVISIDGMQIHTKLAIGWLFGGFHWNISISESYMLVCYADKPNKTVRARAKRCPLLCVGFLCGFPFLCHRTEGSAYIHVWSTKSLLIRPYNTSEAPQSNLVTAATHQTQFSAKSAADSESFLLLLLCINNANALVAYARW